MKTVHVAAGILRRTSDDGADEVLAVQRGYGDMAGLWEFPGGKVEHGETPEDACRRELREELQVKITSLQDFYTLEYDYPDFHLSMNCFFCSLDQDSGEPQPNDCQRALRWVHRSSLATLEWMPADIELVELLAALEEHSEVRAAEAHRTDGAAREASDARTAVDNDASDSTEALVDSDAPSAQRNKAKGPKRTTKRAIKKRRAKPKPDLLDGIDTSNLSDHETALVRRRAAIRKSMQGNKRKNTKPELLVRQRLRAAGLTGYRLDWAKAPGRPDIAFPGRKIAIFVNGCYWHRCPNCNPSQPKKNVEFWEAKFRRNVERDRRALKELNELGWCAITIWECGLKRDRIDATMERVIDQIRTASESTQPASHA